MQQPNILLICGEDTGCHYGCYGDRAATTPNVDRLAAEGCLFANAYSTAPVCAPARSTIVTGQYPMKLGTHLMRTVLCSPPRLFTQELRDAGYHVGWHLKLDFNLEAPDGWRDSDEDWVPPLRDGKLNDKPFFLFTNIGITHESSMWPDDDPTHPPPAFTHHGESRPMAMHDPDGAPVPPYLPDVPEVRGDIARHYDNLNALDDRVGEILAALEASGQADNTIVLYISDHGRGLPREKRWPYTAGIHVPLIVRWPGKTQPGETNDQLVSWVDLAPTLLSLAGVPIPSDYDGRPFLGPDASERDVVFAGRDRIDETYDFIRVVRDRRYHYQRNFYPNVPYAQRSQYMENMQSMKALRRLAAAEALEGDERLFMAPDRPAEELFDVQTDPHCLRNLADDPAHANALAAMRERLNAFMAQVDDKGLTSEQDLIEQGLVTDSFPSQYREWEAPLPAEHQIRGISSVFDQPDAALL